VPVQASPKFSCPGPISRHYANRRTWEACPIDCMETLGNIYRNGSQACRPKGKTYIDTQLGELVHSVAGEKRGEEENVVEWQPPRASGCEAATSSRG
jgi:hypothetical protein